MGERGRALARPRGLPDWSRTYCRIARSHSGFRKSEHPVAESALSRRGITFRVMGRRLSSRYRTGRQTCSGCSFDYRRLAILSPAPM